MLSKTLTDKTLILADGRSVALPFIKRLPMNDPVFLKALKHGVEVGQDGEVVGLITVYRTLRQRSIRLVDDRRINLSDLAGFMDPDGIDDSIVHPDEIKFLKENESRSLDRHGLPFLVMHKAYKMRSIYEAAKAGSRSNPMSSVHSAWTRLISKIRAPGPYHSHY